MKLASNWEVIEDTCPEFVLNKWDIVLAVIALVGFLMSCLLIRRFKSQLKGSVFLFSLALIDMIYCLLYEYNYFFKTLAIHLRSELMAKVRIRAMGQVKMIEEFGNIFVPILVFYIVIEKVLWTCSSDTRHKWRIFTVDRLKYALMGGTALYSLAAMMVLTWNMMIADIHFCDVLILPLPFKQPVFRFIQRFLIPLITFLLAPLTFLAALVTLCRISIVGEGEKTINQEEVNLADMSVDSERLTTRKIKRSILCMLAIYFLFMVRGYCWYVYVNPRTASIADEKRNSRIMRSWSYDFMNVVFSGSRMIVYYVFCRKGLIVDYPPKTIG